MSRLEYRGYNSAGLAVRDGEKLAEVVKSNGKLRDLAEKTDNGHDLQGTCGIGHTRWATHGAPSQTNAILMSVATVATLLLVPWNQKWLAYIMASSRIIRS